MDNLKQCFIPYTDLISQLNLVAGDVILQIIRAKNSIGWGAYSITPLINDIVKTKPLSPLTSVKEGTLTDDSQIQINWDVISEP